MLCPAEFDHVLFYAALSETLSWQCFEVDVEELRWKPVHNFFNFLYNLLNSLFHSINFKIDHDLFAPHYVAMIITLRKAVVALILPEAFLKTMNLCML